MSNDQKKNPTTEHKSIDAGTEDWNEDVRSLPLYNVEACGGVPVRGYPVDVQVLGKEDNAFTAMIFLLTAPTKAKINDEVVTVEAGKEIFLRGADLRDLESVALDPEFVREYLLTPRRLRGNEKCPEGHVVKDGIVHLKLKGPKQPMPLWDRRKNPKAERREKICPSRSRVLPPAEISRLLLAQKAGEDATSFDTSTMK